MKYGVYVAPFHDFASAHALADLAQEAEEADWDGFFIYDHIARPDSPPVADTTVALAAIAMQTQRIRIGALVTPLARRRPWKFARETAALDQLSGGRLVVGVGTGHRVEEFAAFGEETSLSARARMLDEALEVVTRLWSGEPVNHDGAHFTVDDATFLPTPVQQPRIPVWVGGRWPHRPPFRRAARWDGAVPVAMESGSILTPAEVSDVVSWLREQRPDLTGFEIVHVGSSSPDQRHGHTVRDYADAGATWWLEEIHPRRFPDAGAAWPTAAMRDRIRKGPPAE